MLSIHVALAENIHEIEIEIAMKFGTFNSKVLQRFEPYAGI